MSAPEEVLQNMDASYAKHEEQQAISKSSPIDAKIIRTANLKFQVSDFKKSTSAINQLIQQYKAQLLTANETRTDNTLENNLIIKVLPAQFESLLTGITEQSIYLDSKNIIAEDVTTEYIDISARLKTKKAVEARYLDLLKQAKTVKDIITVEEQLRQMQEEIESTEARLTYLNRQTNYNTINLNYYQKLATTSLPDTSFAVRVRNALQGGWDFMVALLIGLLHLWPLLLVIPIFIHYFRKFIRKYPPVR
ncbi:DUF4349 domain-containing protein [Adhaeribacter radiodurans]|uniref:DUF4349 domain-containing protein n=1 Tax=Adhaeribacter radiodurans TaxID=2745197 RepID=A0A7L7L5M5_9BACT|nr:DUF4349 domain-containing protein [Adhaeribacter radiodurans]QMU28106.1 DUF4349 domain-containing protein [Adhaeribacter radiodurans]